MPKKIGITGGIGTGKSTVCLIFRALGIPIYDADSRAKWLMQNDPILVSQITDSFGSESYLFDGQVNRIFLAKTVFQNTAQLAILNQLVHPCVREDMRKWATDNQEAPYLLKEAALMYESGSYQDLDQIIVVSSPLELRISRIQQRDPHRTHADILAIINQQMPQEEKEKRANWVIRNDANEMLIPQVLTLHHQLLQ